MCTEIAEAPVLRPGPPDGQGGAGYPPQPLSVLPPPQAAEAEVSSHVVGALAVVGEIEAFALLLDRGAQAHGVVDHLV